MSFFSIIIPLFNKEYSIISAIQSIVNQSICDWDLIIIDDGSTDNSLRLVKEFLDKPLVRELDIEVISQRNQGVSAVRNNGVHRAKNNYICFLDADDEWKPDFLYNMKLLIEGYPLAALYCLQHETKLTNRRPIRNPSYYKDGFKGYVNNFFKASLFGSISNSSKVCVKKEAFMIIGGFPENQKSGEDLYVWMELARTGTVAFYNEVNVRINVIDDRSRAGRHVSIPYPFIYYSQPQNIHKLSSWSRLYLRKIYLAHIRESLSHKHYDALLYRAKAGSKLFPIISRPFIILSSIKNKF